MALRRNRSGRSPPFRGTPGRVRSLRIGRGARATGARSPRDRRCARPGSCLLVFIRRPPARAHRRRPQAQALAGPDGGDRGRDDCRGWSRPPADAPWAGPGAGRGRRRGRRRHDAVGARPDRRAGGGAPQGSAPTGDGGGAGPRSTRSWTTSPPPMRSKEPAGSATCRRKRIVDFRTACSIHAPRSRPVAGQTEREPGRRRSHSDARNLDRKAGGWSAYRPPGLRHGRGGAIARGETCRASCRPPPGLCPGRGGAPGDGADGHRPDEGGIALDL